MTLRSLIAPYLAIAYASSSRHKGRLGDVVLELTQIGKKCHAHCAIFHKMGDCIMPREGVFCKIIEGGHIASGPSIDIVA